MTTYLKLLGVPSLRYQEAWHQLPATKASALLFYLAYRGDWVDRGKLVYLFWPDTTEQTARRRLSRILIELKKLLYAKDIEAEPSRLRWQVKTDVQDFVAANNEGRLNQVVQLYGGALLETFSPPNVPEFESWLELERQELHKSWKNAVLTLASDFEGKEQYSQAAEVLERLHKTESFDETIFRRYLENLQQSHQQAKALEIFEHFKKNLEQEFDSAPERETLELIQAIRQGEVLVKTTTVTATKLPISLTNPKAKPRHNLPVQPTQFVGREVEKAELAEYLTDSSCRLLSIVAPGGMGKTRLAIEVARTRVEQFEHSVCFASFVAVNAPEQMIYTIADALDIKFFGQREPKEQLFDYLAEKELLLILDNLEHLLSGVQLIRELLETAPKIIILATSRERLNLQAEHVFDLGGLAVPDEKNSNAKEFDSLQLFAERAKHNRHDFILDNNSMPAVTHICKLVEGMPLAIELATSWLRVLSITDIAREIEKGIGLLETSARDLPARHHSIRAVFDHSWKLLTEAEQTALRRLSVFQGGFRREAALEVSGGSLPILASLVDKSFLSLTLNGRYRRHPLIIQYAQEKLAAYPEEKAQTEEKHGLYYLHFRQNPDEVSGTLKGKETPEAFQEVIGAVKEELANMRSAWTWAIRETRVDELRLFAYHFIYDGLGQPQESLELYSMTVKSLDETNPAHHAALGAALIHQGHCQTQLGYYQEASHSIERGLDLLYVTDEVLGILAGLDFLSFNVWVMGDYEQSKEICDKGLSLARQHGRALFIGDFLGSLAVVIKELDDFPNKEQFYEEGLAEVRQLGNYSSLPSFLHYYAFFLLHNGDLQKAKALARESLELAQPFEQKWLVPSIVDCLGMIAFKLGDYEQAQALLQEAFARSEEQKMPFFHAYLLGNLGKLSTTLGEYARAKQYLKQSLEIGFSTKSSFNMAGSLVPLAELYIAQKQPQQAAEWLSLSLHHPATERHEKIEAKRLLEVLASQLSVNELNAAKERGKALDLTEVVREILATL
jgi:predicted ATPase/DNA-binding SARP family transcriptional activator